ncbi:hypothetical protein BCR42DRAFT_395163 [Absidia repens]|uniref:Uncharacterized protein n=1 Tax=Absidia repens TaxID=90262 RepID=A0A1X2I886_9FUNG|nr:hypothetical protein BCR42DRAFT_395163 [Absidia repens]
MTNIYRYANFMVVPDFYQHYLKSISTNNIEIMKGSHQYDKDIYYLIQGNATNLARLDDYWLDKFGLMEYREHFLRYDPQQVLDHIFETSQASNKTSDQDSVYSFINYAYLGDGINKACGSLGGVERALHIIPVAQ